MRVQFPPGAVVGSSVVKTGIVDVRNPTLTWSERRPQGEGRRFKSRSTFVMIADGQ